MENEKVVKEVSKQDEVEALKDAFNRGQESQRKLMHKIVELVKEGKGGGKEIRFGLNAWTNCWNLQPAAEKRLINDWLLLITNINAGK
jgi:predicted  nucleic acid-binding Zn-ribbon protein